MKIKGVLFERFIEQNVVVNPKDVKIKKETLPLLVDFDPNRPVGTAKIFRKGDKIMFEAQIKEDMLKGANAEGTIEKLDKGFLAVGAGCECNDMVKKDGKIIARGPELTGVSLTVKGGKHEAEQKRKR